MNGKHGWDFSEDVKAIVASEDRQSVTSRVEHFVEHAEGRYIHARLVAQFDQEMRESREWQTEAYAPQVASDLARRAGRMEVLERLCNGRLGLE
jgi:tetrahydromethanopterin S-methyltransferase subunit A